PERIDGQQAGPASDLYAVGVLLYETLTGKKPFEGDDPVALAAAIRDGRYAPPTAIDADADPQIVAVIEQAMRRDPAERYQSAEAMAAALLGDGTDHTATEVIARPTEPDVDTEPDGHETVPIPRMEQTARLPSQASATPPADRPRRPSRVDLIAAGAIVVLALLVILALTVFTGPDTPSANGTDGTTLPASLDDALSELEDSVQP
ncbi:MAG TPA: protein kinase, partial [Actinomycetota bacterium]|nr:protein kinase [Actinomycetota bacterium]